MHNFGPLTGSDSRGLYGPRSDTTFQTRFGLPVCDVSSKLCFTTLPVASLLAVPPHIDSATLDERAEVFGALASETVRNGGFAGAAAEKHDVHEGQNAPGLAGSGVAKTLFLFSVFAQTTYT